MTCQLKFYSKASLPQSARPIGICFAIFSVLTTDPALGQSISIDGSTSTQLNGSNSCSGNCSIAGGLRDGAGSGSNLFHSFSTFNIDTGATVIFTDPGVTNIFNRVTGTGNSNIDGTLKVEGAANLFLLNANGILFGENAQLDIQGSFLSTTADSLVFEGDARFSTSSFALPSLLTVNVPLGLQFGSSSSPIRIQGSGHNLTYSSRNFTIGRGTPTTGLIAANGQALAFLGGDVAIRGGNLIADSGSLAIGSLGKNEFVPFTSNGSGWNFDYSKAADFGNISLSQQASLDVSGNDAGLINLQGRQINLSEGSAIIANVLDSGSGQIAINASESVNLTGVNLSATQRMPTGAYVEISPSATGDGNSQITVKAPALSLTAGAQMGLSMAGSGRSGSVDIAASSIAVDGGSNATPSGLFAAVLPVFGPLPGATGQGGNLNINGGLDTNREQLSADRLSITNGAVISAETYGAGNAGQLDINAKDIEVLGFNAGGPSSLLSASRVSSIPPLPSGSGNGGKINIETERLIVAEGGQVSVATNSPNTAGDIDIRASESVELRGAVEQGRSGLFALARVGPGAGGNIEVKTDRLSLLEGATINASNFSSSSSGPPPGTGPAGNIRVVASDIMLKDDSLITTNTVAGDRANITLQSDSLVLRGSSNISTNATGTATGGNVNIDTLALIALENSDITANATDSFGGRIVVNAETILGTAYREQLTAESDITASSALGPAFSGSVELNSPEVDPTDGLTDLTAGLAAADQIAAACENIDSNTFVVTGRGGLPENASQLLTSQSIWNDFRPIENSDNFVEQKNNVVATNNKFEDVSTIDSSAESPAVVEAQTWSVTREGEVVLGVYAEAPIAPQYSATCRSNG